MSTDVTGQHPHGDHHHDHAHGDPDHVHGSSFWAQLRHAITPHSHDHSESIQTAAEARRDGIRTAWIGLAGMLAVAVIQVGIVAVSGSVALLADTVHSLGHAVTTIPLIIAFRLAARPATRRYRYGFGRAEDLVGILICLVILATVVIIVSESVTALVTPRPLTNLGWVFAAGLVGFAGNEIVAVYRIRGGRRIGSAALIAEGQHARADGFTSLAVAVGITFAWFGYPWVDAVVGLLIGAIVFGIMLSSLRSILRRLMDGVEPSLVDQIATELEYVDGVVGARDVRARWMGHRLSVDAAIAVAPDLTASDIVTITDHARDRVRAHVRHVDDVRLEVRLGLR